MSDFTGNSFSLGFSEARTSSRRPAPQPDQIAPLQGLVVAVLISGGMWFGIAAAIRSIF